MSGLIDIDGLVKIDTTNPLFNFFDSLKKYIKKLEFGAKIQIQITPFYNIKQKSLKLFKL